MIKILFICHGNICRSPMAEYLMRDEVRKCGLSSRFEIASAAVSAEELGHGIYPPAKRILNRLGISCAQHRARQVVPDDFAYYDYLIVMDESNLGRLMDFPGALEHQDKIFKLMSFTGSDADVADPWFTGEFEVTLADLEKGIEALLLRLLAKERDGH